MFKRIASFTKKKVIIKDSKTGKEYEYFVLRIPFKDAPGDEGAAIDVWSDVEHGYMRVELAKTPKH